jgi:hypothetical protein
MREPMRPHVPGTVGGLCAALVILLAAGWAAWRLRSSLRELGAAAGYSPPAAWAGSTGGRG